MRQGKHFFILCISILALCLACKKHNSGPITTLSSWTVTGDTTGTFQGSGVAAFTNQTFTSTETDGPGMITVSFPSTGNSNPPPSGTYTVINGNSTIGAMECSLTLVLESRLFMISAGTANQYVSLTYMGSQAVINFGNVSMVTSGYTFTQTDMVSGSLIERL